MLEMITKFEMEKDMSWDVKSPIKNKWLGEAYPGKAEC
jgi:hypothetical protein